jgi:hypothetical protein
LNFATDDKMTEYSFKKIQQKKFFDDLLNWLLKLGWFIDARTWKTVGNNIKWQNYEENPKKLNY